MRVETGHAVWMSRTGAKNVYAHGSRKALPAIRPMLPFGRVHSGSLHRNAAERHNHISPVSGMNSPNGIFLPANTRLGKRVRMGTDERKRPGLHIFVGCMAECPQAVHSGPSEPAKG
ncbi:hypothetical protein GA0004734_00024490 [Rhizobium sp. 9140]|nr:hypothetical protein GA0004734_00024490 [Rhizobium sp. 9140]